MVHARKDYDRIQDPLGIIPAGEPVFLFRGQDVCLPDILAHYCNLLVKKGVIPEQNFGTPEHPLVTSIQNHIKLVRQWQKTVKIKNPDLKDAGQMNAIESAMNDLKGADSRDFELKSYQESDKNLRDTVARLDGELATTSQELNKALEATKLLTAERNNLTQQRYADAEFIKGLALLKSVDEIKEAINSRGRLSADEIAKIQREQLNKAGL